MVDAPALAGCEGELQLSLHWNTFDNYWVLVRTRPFKSDTHYSLTILSLSNRKGMMGNSVNSKPEKTENRTLHISCKDKERPPGKDLSRGITWGSASGHQEQLQMYHHLLEHEEEQVQFHQQLAFLHSVIHSWVQGIRLREVLWGWETCEFHPKGAPDKGGKANKQELRKEKKITLKSVLNAKPAASRTSPTLQIKHKWTHKTLHLFLIMLENIHSLQRETIGRKARNFSSTILQKTHRNIKSPDPQHWQI